MGITFKKGIFLKPGNRELLIECYRKGESGVQLALRFKVNECTIRKWIKDCSINVNYGHEHHVNQMKLRRMALGSIFWEEPDKPHSYADYLRKKGYKLINDYLGKYAVKL